MCPLLDLCLQYDASPEGRKGSFFARGSFSRLCLHFCPDSRVEASLLDSRAWEKDVCIHRCRCSGREEPEARQKKDVK